MSTFQKIILFFSFVLVLYLLFKVRSFDRRLNSFFSEFQSQKTENHSTVKNTPVSENVQKSFLENESHLEPRDTFVRGDYQYSYYGNRPVLYFDDALIELGMITEFGKCIRIDKHQALCVDGHSRTFLLPCRSSGRPPKTTALALPDGGTEIPRL